MVASILLTLGMAGWLSSTATAGAGGASIVTRLPVELAQRTALLFSVSVLCLAVGASCAAWLRPPQARAPEVSWPAQTPSWLTLGALLPLLVVVFGADPASLWLRATYQRGGAGSTLTGAGTTLSLGAVAVLGYVAVTRRRAVGLALLGTAGYVTLFLALGSRRLPLLPLCFALGVYVALRSRRALIGVALAALVTVALLPLPLFLRGCDSHGLAAYWAALPAFAHSDVQWTAALNNVLVTFPITGLTAYAAPPIPLHHLLVEMNPAPGSWAGWYDISGSLRLNAYTPYSGVGELGNLGWPAVAGFWFGIGVVLQWLDGRCREMARAGMSMWAVAVVGMSGLFALSMCQYNVRNSQRNLLYTVALVAALHLWGRRRSAEGGEDRRGLEVGPVPVVAAGRHFGDVRAGGTGLPGARVAVGRLRDDGVGGRG